MTARITLLLETSSILMPYIILLAKVVGPQIKSSKSTLQNHDSRHWKVIPHDRSDNISHNTY